MQGEAVESSGNFSLHILLKVLYYIVKRSKGRFYIAPFPEVRDFLTVVLNLQKVFDYDKN